MIPCKARPLAGILLAGANALLFSSLTQAHPHDEEIVELPGVTVTGEDEPVVRFVEPAPVAPRATITETEMGAVNVVNPTDIFKYAPGVNFRKRFIGDSNIPITIRANNEQMVGRAMVYVDDLLISNFLGGHSAGARFFLISPQEIAGADIMYGPYSAVYPGNSMGGVVTFHTRMPEEFEFHVNGGFFLHDFKEYGTDGTHRGFKFDTSFGDKAGRFGYFVNYRHLENEGPPQSFRTVTNPNPADGTEPAVTGAFRERDATGAERLVYGSIGPRQVTDDLIKVKLTYDLSDDWALTSIFGYLNKVDEVVEPETYLRDANGNRVYGGNVDFEGRRINASFQGADRTFHEDFHYGLTLDGHISDAWKLTTTGSFYDLRGSRQRSNNVAPDGTVPVDGRVTRQDGTGWVTYDIKLANDSELRPQWLGRQSTFGYHFNNYFRREVTYNAADWRREVFTGVDTISEGKTRTHALFLENTWPFDDERWALTLGGRQEFWEAYDGRLRRGANDGRFDDRKDDFFSPKASLAWRPTEDWEARFSTGIAKRFPMVDELFQAQFDGAGNFRPDSFDPNLKPEKSFSRNLSVIRWFEKSRVIASVFHEDVDDSIIRQDNAITQTRFTQNVDRVRNWGGELAFESRHFEEVTFHANVAYVNAEIRRNSPLPETEGNRVPQIPEWRVGSFATLHMTPELDLTFGARYAADMFHTIQNDDGKRGGFGFTDGYLVFDTKLTWRAGPGFTASFGVDNLTDERYYISHPYPGRTYLLDLAWSF